MNEDKELKEIYDIVSYTSVLLQKSSNIDQDLTTVMYDFDQIRKMQKNEDARKLKGEYELEGMKGTIYDKYRLRFLYPLLGIKTSYWNPHYEFVTWDELFSKMDKINAILEYLRKYKNEFEDILLKSQEIKTSLDTISEYPLEEFRKW